MTLPGVLKLLSIWDALTRPANFIRSNRVDAEIAESGSHDGSVVDVLIEIVAEAPHRF